MNNHDLERKIKYKFKDPSILDLALTHSSYTKEMGYSKDKCNERLEFVGDGFLDAIVGSHLYILLPEVDEGKLSKTRASIVCEKSLDRVARAIDLGEYINLGMNAASQGGRNNDSILADCLEAVIGGIYYDGGYEAAKETVLDLFQSIIEDGLNDKLETDYKSLFQEKVQANNKGAHIHYELVSQSGPDHDKTFVMKLMIDNKEIAEGRGKKKKEAEQEAAKIALQKGEK